MSRTMLAVVFGLLVATAARAADPVNVTVDFSGAPSLSQADKDAILNKMKDKYSGVPDVKISTDAGGKITVKFVDDEGTAWGESDKRGKSATVHVKRASLGAERQGAFDTAEKRQNLWGETGAHELGHTLCATHNRDNPPTLMTEGCKVSYAERAADGRSLLDADKMKINMGIMMLNNNQSWDLDAAYDANDFGVVLGRPATETEPDREDSRVAFDVHVSDALLSVGFINDVGEYVEWVPPGGQGTMEFSAGEFANFAVEFGGQVFTFDGKAAGRATGSLPRTADMAESPALDAGYYGRLDLVFPNVFGQDVVLTLDADAFSSTNGFTMDPPPGTTAVAGANCGSGLCATGLAPVAPLIVLGGWRMRRRAGIGRG